ncbi:MULTISPECIES: glycine/sarcosine/betaine reductase selenoprotein B family protein [Anaeromyxobacter]|uniref:glycine/sarcosine/betaine reductase selenoprotein B family protein n=1 Tax=Anaeromyxobacter TaxID=161492 RepID=UPI001F5AABC4|nr:MULTISPECIES: glycine/sarcosine/betaine reductase selenoprotein B family protein [unclassified Anaeromyxobacter]
MKSFADVERDYIREKLLPDFEFESYDEPSRVNALGRPVSTGTVALVVTAGAYLAGEQERFRRSKEGDPSFRELPHDVDLARIGLSHGGYDTRRALDDVDVVFPLRALRTLERSGRIGAAAPRHYSFMGYAIETDVLRDNGREVARRLRSDAVDLALLVPA